MTTLKIFLSLLGALLIITAVTLLLFVGWLVYESIMQPENVRIVQFVLEQIQMTEPGFSGTIDGDPFNIQFSEALKTVLFLFVGVLMLGAVGGIARSILSVGIELTQAFLPWGVIVTGTKTEKDGAD